MNKNIENRLNQWLTLAGFALAVCVFIYGIGPALERIIPAAGAMGEFIEHNEINAGAMYYTDVEPTGAAELNSIHTFRYEPKGPVH